MTEPIRRDPKSEIARLVDIMAQLRNPQTGCPWDIEQDFASIAPYTIEEAHEVADAYDRVAAALRDMGCYEVSLGDTIGQGTPETIRAMLSGRDTVVVNSCAVTGEAVKQTRAAIRRAS